MIDRKYNPMLAGSILFHAIKVGLIFSFVGYVSSGLSSCSSTHANSERARNQQTYSI